MPFMGMPVVLVDDQPRYVLPAEVIPGVPWPPGFRDEINRWAAGFFKPVNMMDQLGVPYVICDNKVRVSPRGLLRLKAAMEGVFS